MRDIQLTLAALGLVCLPAFMILAGLLLER